MPGEEKSVKRSERSNEPDTALYKNYDFYEVRSLFNATFTQTYTCTQWLLSLWSKAEANLAKLSIFNPNNVIALFFRESVMLDNL